MEKEETDFAEAEDIQKNEKIQRILQSWQSVFNKIFICGLITVLPLLITGIAVWTWVFVNFDDIGPLDNLMNAFFETPLWIPLLFLVLETGWFIWGITCINRLNKSDLKYLDSVKPYYVPPCGPRRRKKKYRRALFEILPSFSVWIYLFLMIWVIGIIKGASFF
jgi:hypothetical protein